jgi:hypothetical protein
MTKRKRPALWWYIRNLIIIGSLLLNLLNWKGEIARKIKNMPLFKREVYKLCIDGAKYRWGAR